jgi:hypothetical protein
VIAGRYGRGPKLRKAPSRLTRAVLPAIGLCGLACAPSCGGGGALADPGEGGLLSSDCPIPPTAQQFLVQVLNQAETGLVAALSKGGPQDVSVQFGLLGLGTMEGSDAHLAMACAAADSSGVTCGSDLASAPLAPGLDTCFQTGCEAAEIVYVDVYITQVPHRATGDRVNISYATAVPYPSGQVTYSPNPLTYWRYDSSAPGSLTVSADLANTISVALAGGGSLDLSHTGRLEGTRSTNMAYTVSLQLPNLSPSGPVSVSVQNSGVAPRAGKISIGSTTVAILSQSAVVWEGACH